MAVDRRRVAFADAQAADALQFDNIVDGDLVDVDIGERLDVLAEPADPHDANRRLLKRPLLDERDAVFSFLITVLSMPPTGEATRAQASGGQPEGVGREQDRARC